MPASYLVFARKEYQQPLEWIGRVMVEAAPAPEGAVQAEVGRQAREQFGEAGWVEMVAVPETAFRRVIPMD